MLEGIDKELLQIYMDFFNVNTTEALESKLIELYGYNVAA